MGHRLVLAEHCHGCLLALCGYAGVEKARVMRFKPSNTTSLPWEG